ncbi:MAG TPA: flavodoxin-dependent (E)-4-hydroxy-3-methylbut-2-enyl-diphosphate synthase [Acidimicrobiales bacterium]|nr:flavodoxin-dependent (E)-4-hydroxy-3-methylbut-2-enyl-diphosphate synthase [Acidimicrobiales bacterium]
MGCVVNGPGEARSADLGIAAGKEKVICSSRGRSSASSRSPRWCRPWSQRQNGWSQRASKPGSPQRTRPQKPKPRRTAGRCSTRRARTRTPRRCAWTASGAE